jgi:DnaK suppressor protein
MDFSRPEDHFLNPSQWNELKTALIEQRDHLLRIARNSINQQVSDDTPPEADSLDVSTDESMKMTELRLRDREKYLLNKIEKALKRMHEGEYGYCVECDAEIGFARLNARRVAELCIDCKEEQERNEKNMRDRRDEDSSRSFFL